MAIRRVWLGDQGPFLFDDAKNVLDPAGTYSGETNVALRSESSIVATEFFGILASAILVSNIDNPSTELNAISASTVGSLIFCYDVNSGVPDEFTMYLWDTDYGSENVPYVVDGASGGGWVAVGGKYKNTGRSSVVTDANTSHATASFANVNTALNALGGKINDLIDALQTARIMGT